jgi:phosphoglycolate phosphatase-like HAD superfamily hydrolase
MHKSWLLLFDIDGTLIRTDGAGVRAFNFGFLDVMGWPDALSQISPAGMTDLGIAQKVARRFQGQDLTADQTRAVFERYLHRLSEELRLAAGFRVLPGILNFLQRINNRPDFLLGLGTGNLEQGARLKLERGSLNPYFAFGGFGSDSADRVEVLRCGHRRAEERTGRSWPLQQVLIIGDTPLDVAAGRSLGAKTLAVATGPFSQESLRCAGADFVVETFADEQTLQKIGLD